MGSAAIPLEVRVPQIESPVQTIGGLMQLKSGMADIALKQQQTRTAAANASELQAQADQRTRDLTDQNTAQEWLKDPTNAYNFAKGDLSGLLAKGIQPKTYDALQKSQNEALTAHTALDTATLKNNAERLAGIQQGLDGLTTLPDDAARAEAWHGLKQQWTANGWLKDVPPDAVPDTITGKPEEVQLLAARLNAAKGLTEAALARKETIQKTVTSAAQQTAAEAEAKLHSTQEKGAGFENVIKEAESKLVSQDPAERAKALDNMGLDPDIKALAAGALGKAVKLEDQRAVLEKAASEQATRNTEKNPAVLAARRQNEIAVRTGVAEAMNATGHELEKVPLAQRNEVSNKYEKSLTELGSSAADANRIHSLIVAAQAGNKAAPALVSIAELRGYLNRINQTELKSVGGAGSLIDNIEGWVKGKTEGQPVPPGILKAVDGLAKIQMENAEQKHQGEVSALNLAHKSTLSVHKVEDLGYRKPGAPVRMKAPNGQTKEVDEAEVEHYKSMGAMVVQ